MMILLVILVLGGYALYTMTPDERTRLKERLVATATARRTKRRGARPSPNRFATRFANGPPGRS